MKMYLYLHNIHQPSIEIIPELNTAVTIKSISIMKTSHPNTGIESISEILHTSNTPWATGKIFLAGHTNGDTAHTTD
jgi:hypothetical protein